jgi:hypothetical protein
MLPPLRDGDISCRSRVRLGKGKLKTQEPSARRLNLGCVHGIPYSNATGAGDKLNYSPVDLLGSLLLGPMTATWETGVFSGAAVQISTGWR